MKLSILYLCSYSFCTLPILAQDILVTNEGEAKKVYNLEIGQSAIFYQEEDNSNSQIKRIPKCDVLIIRKQDGTKIDPNATPSTNGEFKKEQIINLANRQYGLRTEAPTHKTITTEMSSDISIAKKKGTKTFEAKTPDGQQLIYEIISENEKTLKVIARYRNSDDDLDDFDETETTTKYVIPEYVNVSGEKYTVTEIGKGAFYGSKVDDVVFPNTLKVIRFAAFRNTRLKNIILPQGLELIEADAFRGVGRKGGISEIYIPKTVKDIGEACFKESGKERSFRGYYQGYVSCLPDFITEYNCTYYGLDEEAVEPYLESEGKR